MTTLPDLIRSLDDALQTRVLSGGDELFAAGDAPDGLAMVERGRLAVIGEDGRTIGVIGRDEIIGEIGALSGVRRTQSVVATRDTELRVISQEHLETLLISNPVIGRELARIVVGRLAEPPAASATTRVPSTVAIARVDPSIDIDTLTESFARLIDRSTIIRADDMAELSESERLGALDRRERDNEITLLDVGVLGADNDWATWCLRQADDVLIVANAVDSPRAHPDLVASVRQLDALRCVTELVLANDAAAVFPIDGTAWRATVEPDRLHHLRSGDGASADRIVRLVTGRGVGLILSGGGAKGLAHIGAWRAIEELELDIDAVAGVSFGALMAAGVALDYTADQLHEMVTERLIDQRSIFDPTFPFVSVLRGAGVSDELQDVGAGRTFDQVWRPFLCSSCDLVSGKLVDHTRGPLWKAVRASLSIPGVFPPLRDGDALLVDGAVRDNLPINSLRAAHPTPLRIIAVDVGKTGGMDAGQTPDDGAVSGWRQLGRRLNPRSSSNVPNLAQIMMRVVELAGTDSGGSTGGTADIAIRPDLAGLGIADLGQIAEYEQAGYEAAMIALV